MILALKDIPDVRLVIAGNDEERYIPKLQALARDCGVASRVEFVGPKYAADKEMLFRRALLTALPSYSENFGNVVIEAMAAGCPVAVTKDVGAAGFVTDSGGGVLLEGEPTRMAASLRALISDPAALKRMGKNGHKFVAANLSWDAVCIQMEKAYSEAMLLRQSIKATKTARAS